MGSERPDSLREPWKVLLVLVGLIAAGIGAAAAIGWFVEYQKTHWTPDAVWVRLTAFSALTIFALIKAFRPRWRRTWFWFTFVLVMAVRTVIYVEVLRRFPDWPLIGFALVTPVEIEVLVTVLLWLNYTREEAEASH